jgi:hypothetical protein
MSVRCRRSGTATVWHFVTEAMYGGIWSRPGLSMPDRMLCTLAALAVWPRPRQLRRYMRRSISAWPPKRSGRCWCRLAGLYAGFSVGEETLALMAEVLAERGVPFPPDPPAEVPLEVLASRGRGAQEGSAEAGCMRPCVPSVAAMLDRDCARSRRRSVVGTKKRPPIEQRNNTRNAINGFAELDAYYLLDHPRRPL